MTPSGLFAHSLPDPDRTRWERLSDHSARVAAGAAAFGERFGWREAARAAGLLHDAGKASDEFQSYIRGGRTSGGDHSTAGARIVRAAYGERLGRSLAACVAGHHGGLPDADDLDRRLDPAHPIPAHDGWAAEIAPPPGMAELRPTRRFSPDPARPGFAESFLTRMLFSCLVDADFLATEAFMSGGAVARGGATDLSVLRDRLRAHMARVRSSAAPSPLNALRGEVLDHAVGMAGAEPGFFTLTVPTGGGKTLASLAFGLEHACARSRSRVIHVAPFTAIIEQTARVFREAVGERDVLEHHAGFDWEAHAARARDGGDERDGLGALRRAAENWDAPVVVTTAVQLFESLFAARTSSCRKLHNLVDAVIVLDEAQTLPVRLLLPCLAALDELRRTYGATIVLCTATQPALRRQDGALVDRKGACLGLDIPGSRELAPRPAELLRVLRRAAAEVLPGPVDDATIAERFGEAPQMLCIVNTRAHARALFDRIADQPGAVHLTTLMCPAHRRAVLAELRARLKDGRPARLVATSLIEAGVDVSFPEVWRARAGLDSIAQAAGRCNREAELAPALGRVVVFTPVDDKVPASLRAFRQAADVAIRDHADILSPEAVAAYFRELYFQKGADALDAAEVDGRRGILCAISELASDWRFPFESVAGAFRMIDEAMQPVVVPWNDRARELLDRLAVTPKPSREDLRAVQPFTVSIPKGTRDLWLAEDYMVAVRRDMGDALLRFRDTQLYGQRTGVNLSAPDARRPEDNCW